MNDLQAEPAEPDLDRVVPDRPARGELPVLRRARRARDRLRVRRALATLAKKTQRLEVLGSFPRSEPVG